jgi:predicted nucleotidyltransferase
LLVVVVCYDETRYTGSVRHLSLGHIMDMETLRNHKQDILSLAQQYGAMNVRVFGSVARGDTHESSDIDLLIDVKQGTSLMDFVRLKLSLEDLLGQDVDLVEASAVKPRLKTFIDEDAIPL